MLERSVHSALGTHGRTSVFGRGTRKGVGGKFRIFPEPKKRRRPRLGQFEGRQGRQRAAGGGTGHGGRGKRQRVHSVRRERPGGGGKAAFSGHGTVYVQCTRLVLTSTSLCALVVGGGVGVGVGGARPSGRVPRRGGGARRGRHQGAHAQSEHYDVG